MENGFLSTTMARIDRTVTAAAETVFGQLEAAMLPVLAGMGALGLGWIAISALIAQREIVFSDYLTWMLRFVMISSVVTSWAFFSEIYKILTVVPPEIAGAMIPGGSTGDVWAKADDLLNLFSRSDETCGISALGACLRSLIGFIVYAAFALIVIVIVGGAKIGLAFSIGMAPVFVATLLFRATANLFEAWVKFTMSFALTPLIAAGLAESSSASPARWRPR